MAIKLVREFQQKQQLALTPQLRKSIDLLQLSRLEIIITMMIFLITLLNLLHYKTF